MSERLIYPDIDFSRPQYEFVPYSLIRGHQSFALAPGVFKFLHLYQDGEPVQAPEAYFDNQRGFFIIQDGHRRLKSMKLLADRGVANVGRRTFVQNIAIGVYLSLFELPVYRKPHTTLFEIDKIEIREI